MNELDFIRNFISRYSDFGDINGYRAVYRPTWHPSPVSFWFNPPFDENGESNPSPSGILLLSENGSIFVENFDNGEFYNIEQCLGDTIENAVYAIQTLGK